MFDMSPYLVLIPLLPLLASVLIAFLGPRLLRHHSHWPCVLASLCSCALSFLVLWSVGRQEEGRLEQPYYTWILTDRLSVEFALQADGLTAIMLTAITFIGSLIAIYSVGYMHGDEGYPRFFAEISRRGAGW